MSLGLGLTFLRIPICSNKFCQNSMIAKIIFLVDQYIFANLIDFVRDLMMI